MRVRIIYNPTSGNESFKYDLTEIIEKLTERGYLVEVTPTRSKGNATDLAASASDSGVDLIIAAGGDGTLNEIVNGVMKSKNLPEILFIPSGTTNDIASTLDIPKDPIKCLNLLDDGVVAKIDVGKINDKYFVYEASTGVFTKVTYTTPSLLKTHLGYYAYLISSIQEIPKLEKPNRYEIEVDGEIIDDDYVFIMFSNTTGFGGFKNIFRETKLNDGKFDITLVPKANIKLVGDAINSILRGVSKKNKDIGFVYKTASKITVKCGADTNWNIDGELGPTGNIEISNQKQAIKIYVSKKAHKKLF